MISLPIHLSPGFIPSVVVGDIVKTGDILAKKSQSQDVSVNIAEELGVNPRSSVKTLKKNPGDQIRVGDILAEKKGFVGLNKSQVESQIEGTMLRFERDRGVMVIQLHDQEMGDNGASGNLVCPIDGTISLCDNGQIVIDTDKNIIAGIAGVGGSCQAEIRVLAKLEKTQKIEAYQLTPETINTIIVGREFDRELLLKAIGIGVIGIITTHVARTDTEYLAKKHLLIPIITVDDAVYSALQQMDGKTVYMDANTATILPLTL